MSIGPSEIVALLLAAVHIYHYESIDPNLKPKDVPPPQLWTEYDFIVVGAGTAGSILANRLSENPKWKILLIEAGGDENPISDTPLLASVALENTRMDWNYTTMKQRNVCGNREGRCAYPRGRVLGGSSTINYMAWVRGDSDDFNEWARLGSPNWSYSNVLPYFILSENISSIKHLAKSTFRGTDGPLHVQYPVDKLPLSDELVQAGVEIGLQHKDYNVDGCNSIDYLQYSMKGHKRLSAAAAYLNPIRNRANLHVAKHSFVTQIQFNSGGNSATGIKFMRDGTEYSVKTKKEVILSAGAVNTPHILMLSGIGPQYNLKWLGIQVVHDLPVGRNLQDHLMVTVFFKMNLKETVAAVNESVFEYSARRRGLLTRSMGGVTALTNLHPNSTMPPTIQYIMGSAPYFLTKTEEKNIILGITVVLLKPESRGGVYLKSKNPFVPPAINPNYLSHKDDTNVLTAGLHSVLEIINASPLRKYRPQLHHEFTPLCQDLSDDWSEYTQCMIEQYAQTVFHPIGTAKMGSDEYSVVNQDLQVRGVSNLRVVDASIMPTIVRANTNAAVVMIGEKAADIIKKRYEQ